jgi:ankyrin repeat protein
MFPNPHDALPLPPRPSLEQYKKRAKDLLQASQSLNPTAVRDWATHWIDSLVRLSDLTITPQLPVRVEHWADQLDQFARRKLSETTTLAAAQFVVARAQGFESWPQLAQHVEATGRANSPVSHFELAADAIVNGDTARLERVLREHPDLIRARSTRRHQATLLHYISANGVEGYRQKTPNNIWQIAELLLRAGADVNAVADVYGGSTTLALVATSLHPERAGAQNALLQLLLDRGATLDPVACSAKLIVTACLANGRVQAAEFLAQRGARLDLEGAAGLGRLDVVETLLDESSPAPASPTIQIERALLWACEYGRNPVIEFLLRRGVPLQSMADTGQTALHWAVIGGHLDTINLLRQRGASLEAKNAYGGTALGQALWSALYSDDGMKYLPAIETLLKAGAPIEPGTLKWLAEQKPVSSQATQNIATLLRNHGASS